MSFLTLSGSGARMLAPSRFRETLLESVAASPSPRRPMPRTRTAQLSALPDLQAKLGPEARQRRSSPTVRAVSIPVPDARSWPAILTWQAHNASRMESVRVQISGNRIKAAGRIIGAAAAEHPPFSASYDLVTDENGVTRRLSLRIALAGGERQMSISRDVEGTWMVESGSRHQRSTFNGALDVDVVLSPFFNSLPIRRCGLQERSEDVEVPVVYVNLLDLTVEGASATYSSGSDGIHVLSPSSSSTLKVDVDGFVLDYPSLARRI